jgi:hypothetical protein
MHFNHPNHSGLDISNSSNFSNKLKTGQMKPDIKQFNPGEELLEYFESKASFKEAWNGCEQGDWMLRLACCMEVDDRLLAGAKALCAGTVRQWMEDGRSVSAIEAALRYASGEISRGELDLSVPDAKAAAYAAIDAVIAHRRGPEAIRYAVACEAAIAASSAAMTSSRVSPLLSGVATHAADAVYYAAGDTHSVVNRRQTAGICREALTEAVMERAKELTAKQDSHVHG